MRKRLTAIARKRSILDAAIKSFAANGAAGMTTANLAAEIGVSEPILYRHFDSKEKILEGILKDVAEQVAEQLKVLTKKDKGEPFQAIKNICSGYTNLARKYEAEFGVINRFLVEVRSAKMNKLLKKHYEMYVGLLEPLIEECQRSGHIRKEISANTAAWHLVNSALGYLMTKPFFAGKKINQKMEQPLIELALNGLLTQKGMAI
jgi:TetR/AcrR family transcriptional regulator